MALGGVITCILMRRRFRKEYKYTDTLALTELSMSALGDDYDGNSSAVSPRYETTSTKKIDENSLIWNAAGGNNYGTLIHLYHQDTQPESFSGDDEAFDCRPMSFSSSSSSP
jgi:hypothetical protein